MVQEAFNSEYYPRVDSKARVSVPAPFRRILESGDPQPNGRNRLYMIYGGTNRRYVECYSMEGARDLTRRIMSLPRSSQSRAVASRTFLTQSVTVEIDDDGRIVLPQPVRDKMEITPEDLTGGLEAAFAGDGQSFQLWKRSIYEVDVLEKMAEWDRQVLGDQDPSTLLPDDFPEI